MTTRIKLETVEALLGISLYENMVSMGFDTSVHSTGIAIIRTTADSLILDTIHKITIPKEVIGNDALDLFIEQLDSFKEKVSRTYKVDVAIIEDCFFGKNVNTLKALARHGILVYDRFKRIAKESKFVMPKDARSRINFKKSSPKIKGHQLKKEIIEYINNILDLELKVKDNDIADAIVLALAGLVIR